MENFTKKTRLKCPTTTCLKLISSNTNVKLSWPDIHAKQKTIPSKSQSHFSITDNVHEKTFQQLESVTPKPFVTLKQLPIPAGPWERIRYDLLTGLPVLDMVDIILKVIGWFNKMAHLVPLIERMTAKHLADMMLMCV